MIPCPRCGLLLAEVGGKDITTGAELPPAPVWHECKLAADPMCSCGHHKDEHEPMGLTAPCFFMTDEHVGKHALDVFCSCGDFSESNGFGPNTLVSVEENK